MKDASKKDKLIYTLSQKSLIIIVVYYFIILGLGLFCTIKLMLNLKCIKENNLLSQTIIGSLSASSMLCCLQYFKRIYKACLDNRIETPSKGQSSLHFGNILYFLLRPIYSYVFVLVMIFALLAGFIIISPSVDFILNHRFLYLCIILSSFIGFSIGRVLDGFELLSTRKIDEILYKENNYNERS